ncbi:TPA: multidrug efflux RND transporter permease subunit TbtB [Pseudomonas aeruginosa]|uniref:Efflux pump membrane transporter n=1 Tax=Pseudomonas aeruginosa TaxID=287 RepID=A0A7L9F0T6_PSEAI|nr:MULTISPECIES: multidrug efflux RND transporter permease subunit TbtB [Pseudomonas aeruginosa group]KSR63334.1 multidrug efflux RND transporter permease subunit [Pseudomonas aeruginosa]MBI7504504.1 multidrug efflux RND transporter permease subunit TbtB [Pseudomonas aeruginosa]MBI8276814.1 multidrug efflux RND transporter permease subunit TbtB [Pseudomonas aeruginosa]MBI8443342.1 multidrug efflux RND transporter permease subunit TbtB [Pseudomonas aeruginosa]MBN0386110.1 multidrug efflux RND t
MSRFFIDRPIFAWVLAIVAMLAGALSLVKMPISQYPNIAAPAVAIAVSYPGASAQTVQDTVVQVIEQQLSGLDGFRYMSAESASDGSMTIIVTFEQGTDPDIAQVQVQNKLQLATPRLPEEVQRQGLRVVKYQQNFFLIIGLADSTGKMSNFDLGNVIASQLQDPISRIDGVGDYMLFGSPNAMRIWLDPAKLNSYQLTPGDVADAIREQNVQVSSGQLGGLPTRTGVQLNATVLGKTRMTTPAEFEEILVKVKTDGSQIRVKDVAQVALGADNFSISSTHNGKPSAGLALRLASGGNLLETVEAVKAEMEKQKAYLPEGIEVFYPYDTTPVVEASISSVVNTIVEAVALVFLVMYLFLQNFRATLIPTLAVPVVLLGAFALLPYFGLSINVLTMYAMVLAIGLLVDDAIVVVENVERLMHEEGLTPLEATRKSMGQIQGALVGIGLVLSAVFVPMAFFGGSAGIIYKQFAVTIVLCMSLSVLVALIFTPALCATILKKPKGDAHHEKKGFFGWFNRTFDRGTNRFERGVGGMLKHRGRYLLAFMLITAGTGYLFTQIPKAFLPNEDQGLMMVEVRMPVNSSAERTQAVLQEVSDYLGSEEDHLIDHVLSINGFNFAGRGQNSGLTLLMLKDWSVRQGDGEDVFSLAERANARFAQIKDATVMAFVPPAILEMGNAMGFNLFLQDNSGVGHAALMDARNQFLQLANGHPHLRAVRPNGKDDEPQFQVNIDDEKARALQVSIASINETMSAAWGSMYVNDFIDQGRVKRVYIQGQDDSRISPEDFGKWYVRNALGEMVPFSAFATGEWVFGSPKLERYGGISSVEILGEPAPGYSTGDAMVAIAEIMKELPPGIGLSYTGLSYEEIQTGDQAPMLYALTVLIVFLCLAALYESWSVPVSVMMVVPLGILGAVLATLMRELNADVYFQIGLMTTVGLSAKNAILIVEFAKDLYEKEGMPLVDAAVHAARLRLRPIVMTSLAFTFGVLPMALASGAGAGSQHSVATGVVGGMVTATVLAVFFVPLFYVVVVKLFEGRKKAQADGEGESA